MQEYKKIDNHHIEVTTTTKTTQVYLYDDLKRERDSLLKINQRAMQNTNAEIADLNILINQADQLGITEKTAASVSLDNIIPK